MNPTAPTDPELLADWLDHRREVAFGALVARYAGLVQMTAKRTCGDDSLAMEAAQLTFIALAQKAKSLVSCASLGGWLHQTAMLQAKNLLRKSQREHRKRELLQTAMETESPAPSPNAWQDLQPILDDALAALSAADREALLLRFYRSLSVKEIAAILGIATDAAQKRVDRATDRLRGKLVRRGCQAGGSLSAVMLAGFAADVQAAAFAVPLFTAKAIAAGAVSSGAFTAATAFLTASAMKTITAVVSLVIVLAAGAWIAKEHWPAPVSVSDRERQTASASGDHPEKGFRQSASVTTSKNYQLTPESDPTILVITNELKALESRRTKFCREIENESRFLQNFVIAYPSREEAEEIRRMLFRAKGLTKDEDGKLVTWQERLGRLFLWPEEFKDCIVTTIQDKKTGRGRCTILGVREGNLLMREGNAPMPADGAINVLYSISFSFDSNWRFSHLFAPDGGGFASGEDPK